MTIKKLKEHALKATTLKDMRKEYKKFWKANHKYSFRVWKKKHLYF